MFDLYSDFVYLCIWDYIKISLAKGSQVERV